MKILKTFVFMALLTTVVGVISNPESKKDARLFDAVRNQDLTAIDTALKEGANVNARKCGATPLFYVQGNAAATRLLIQHGADVNACDVNGFTPLCVAGDVEQAEALLNAGALVNAQDKRGRTPFWRACTRYLMNGQIDDLKLIDFLLKSGALVNAKDNQGHYYVDELLRITCGTAPLGWYNHAARFAAMLIKGGAKLSSRIEDEPPYMREAMQQALIEYEAAKGNGRSTEEMVRDAIRQRLADEADEDIRRKEQEVEKKRDAQSSAVVAEKDTYWSAAAVGGCVAAGVCGAVVLIKNIVHKAQAYWAKKAEAMIASKKKDKPASAD